MSNRLVSSPQSNGSADLNNCAHSRQDNVDILYNPKKGLNCCNKEEFYLTQFRTSLGVMSHVILLLDKEFVCDNNIKLNLVFQV